MLFVNVILPVFLLAFAGYVIERKCTLDRQTLANVSLLLFSPALVFSSLLNRDVAFDQLTRLGLYMLIYTTVFIFLAVAVARLNRFDANTTRALILTTAMMNIGNFGLPLAYFAYGDAALNTSILIFVLFSIPLGSLAIIIAQGNTANWRAAIRNTLRIPIFHAVVLALAIKSVGYQLPQFILRPIELLGQAAIPLMLVLLGMQLATSSVRHARSFYCQATILRLIIGPLLGFLLATWLGMSGLTRNVVVLQTSTPAAVLTLLYAIKFDTRPDLVSGAVFWGTLASAGTLTLLLYCLGV